MKPVSCSQCAHRIALSEHLQLEPGAVGPGSQNPSLPRVLPGGGGRTDGVVFAWSESHTYRLSTRRGPTRIGFFAANEGVRTRSGIQGHESHAEGRGFAGNISRQPSMRSWLLGPGDGPKIG